MQAGGKKQRIPLWDNARWVAVTLVVVGHGILKLIGDSDSAYATYLFIYLFHVPVFVAVSGYFSKSGQPGPKQAKRLLSDIVLPYLIFETIWTLVHWALSGELSLDYATASWTLWYLVALAIWRVALPYLVLLRYPLLIAVVVSIGAGYLSSLDGTLSLARTLGLLPFFVFGWRLRQSSLTARWLALPEAAVWRWRAAAIALFAAVAATFALGIDFWREILIRRFLLYDEQYSSFGFDEWWSGAVRLAVMVVAAALVIAFLVLIPRRRTFFTAWGTATMYIYLLHTFVLYPIREGGVLDDRTSPLWSPLWLIGMIVFSVLLSALLAQPFIRTVFRPLVQPPAGWMFRRAPETDTGTLVLPREEPK